MSDALATILAMIRAELPEMDPLTAARIEIRIRTELHGPAYIAAQPKRVNLLRAACLPPESRTADEMQRAFGVPRATAFRALALVRDE